ncbi:ribonuclease H-like domain-containing protein [Tanacetum coccineum]
MRVNEEEDMECLGMAVIEQGDINGDPLPIRKVWCLKELFCQWVPAFCLDNAEGTEDGQRSGILKTDGLISCLLNMRSLIELFLLYILLKKHLRESQSSVFNSSVNNRGVSQRPSNSGNSSRNNNVTRPSGGGNRRTNGGPQLVCEELRSSCHFYTDDQLSKIISLIKDNSLNNGKGVQANMATGVIVDSGANQHLTYTDKFLVNVINISNLGIKVSHPNGTEAVITSVGDMILSKTLTLYDVLVVPEYCDLREMKVLGTGNQIDGLLGHPSDQVLKVLQEELAFDNNDLVLERKAVIYSRDVRFFEKVFPFKIRQPQDTNLTCQGLDHVSFFDEIVYENPDTSNDDHNKNARDQSDGSNSPVTSSSTFDQNVNDLGHSQGSNGSASEDEMAATFDPTTTNSEDDVVASEPISDSVPTTSAPHVRRSERTSVFPKRYNDFVVDSKVKYGLENYVSYVNLSTVNRCFTTELNKSFEPKSFYEASKDQHWIEAMNDEMNALYSNDTWEVVELPLGRKAIGGIDFDETFSPVVKIVTIRAMASVTSEIVWILKILKDLNREQFMPVTMYCDSQAAIKIAANPVFHERTKNLEIDLHFVREKILSGVLRTQKIGSADQTADIFTKGLDKLQHNKLVKQMGLYDCFQVFILLDKECSLICRWTEESTSGFLENILLCL